MKKVLIVCGCLILLSLIVTAFLLQSKNTISQVVSTTTSPTHVKPKYVGANFTLSPTGPDIISGKVGEDMEVLVNMQPVAPVKEIQLEVQYDNSNLTYVGYKLGTNFQQTKTPEVKIDKTRGRAQFHFIASDSYQKGGALMTLTLLPKTAGTSSITIAPDSFVLMSTGEKKSVAVPDTETFVIDK